MIPPPVLRRIQNTSSVVDAFGHVFFNDLRLMNLKSARTTRARRVATVIEGSLHEAGVSYDREVPGVFTDLLPVAEAHGRLREVRE